MSFLFELRGLCFIPIAILNGFGKRSTVNGVFCTPFGKEVLSGVGSGLLLEKQSCPGSVQGFFWKSRVVRGRVGASFGKTELSGVGSGLLLEKQCFPRSGQGFFWKSSAFRGQDFFWKTAGRYETLRE